MARYINKTNPDDIKSFRRLQLDHPNVSMRDGMTEIFDYHIIDKTGKPQDTNTHYYVKGAIVNYKETWDEVAYTPEELVVNLEKLKDNKRKEMKQARDADISTTTTVTVPSGSYEIDCDQVARSNLHQSIDNAEIAGLTDADTTQWKMADNSFVTVSYGELKTIGLQIAQFISSKYTQEAMKNVEIDNATFDTIESITWE